MLLLLSGCSLDVNGAVGEVGSALAPHCGWHRYPERAPNAYCSVIAPEQPGCGILPAGIDPCDMSPEAPLRVDVGEPYTEWHRAGAADCQYEDLSCR